MPQSREKVAWVLMRPEAVKIERKEPDSWDRSEMDLARSDNNLDVSGRRGRKQQSLRLLPWGGQRGITRRAGSEESRDVPGKEISLSQKKSYCRMPGLEH